MITKKYRSNKASRSRRVGRPRKSSRSRRAVGRPRKASRSRRRVGRPRKSSRSRRAVGRPRKASRSSRKVGRPRKASRSRRGAGKPRKASRSRRGAGKPRKAVWSVSEWQGLPWSYEPYPNNVKTISYGKFYVKSAKKTPLTLRDLYTLATRVIVNSGDDHHIFIEKFERRGNKLFLTTGS